MTRYYAAAETHPELRPVICPLGCHEAAVLFRVVHGLTSHIDVSAWELSCLPSDYQPDLPEAIEFDFAGELISPDPLAVVYSDEAIA